MKSKIEIRKTSQALDTTKVTAGPAFPGSPTKTVSLATRIILGVVAAGMLLSTIASSIKGF